MRGLLIIAIFTGFASGCESDTASVIEEPPTLSPVVSEPPVNLTHLFCESEKLESTYVNTYNLKIAKDENGGILTEKSSGYASETSDGIVEPYFWDIEFDYTTESLVVAHYDARTYQKYRRYDIRLARDSLILSDKFNGYMSYPQVECGYYCLKTDPKKTALCKPSNAEEYDSRKSKITKRANDKKEEQKRLEQQKVDEQAKYNQI